MEEKRSPKAMLMRFQALVASIAVCRKVAQSCGLALMTSTPTSFGSPRRKKRQVPVAPKSYWASLASLTKSEMYWSIAIPFILILSIVSLARSPRWVSAYSARNCAKNWSQRAWSSAMASGCAQSSIRIFQWRTVFPDMKDSAILTLVLKDANAGFCEFKSM